MTPAVCMRTSPSLPDQVPASQKMSGIIPDAYRLHHNGRFADHRPSSNLRVGNGGKREDLFAQTGTRDRRLFPKNRGVGAIQTS